MSLLNKKVKILCTEDFRNNTRAEPGEYIGTVFFERGHLLEETDHQCLVQLAPHLTGWSGGHMDFEKYNCEDGYTYWWISAEVLEKCSNSLMETE